MNRHAITRSSLAVGALAGLVDGILIGDVRCRRNYPPLLASPAQTGAATSDAVSSKLIETIIRAGFEMLTRRKDSASGELLFWGLYS